MTNENTLYKKLYKLNVNGSTQVWEIHHNNNSYWSVSGKLDGKMTISAPTMVEPKQTRTLTEQIIFICESQINKKKDRKYVENIQYIHRADDDLVGFSPQLAHKYDDQKEKIKFPCAAQRKYDGIRCLSTASGFYSRGRKKFTSCTHIWAELEQFFKTNPKARLDGEFYTHEYKEDFEKICKAVKKTSEKATPEDIESQKMVEYHVYDAPRISGLTEKDSFKSRQTALAKALSKFKYIKVVETIYDIKNESELKTLKEQWIQENYEGIMIRNINSSYEGKRSYNLLKWKDFLDKEFVIVGINEGAGKLAGHAGSFTFKMKNGKQFDAKLVGSIERLKYYFKNPKECIGKLATVRFQNYTSDGLPRFPVCKSIRDYE